MAVLWLWMELASRCSQGKIFGLPDPLVDARETGIFRSYKINGVPASSILLIPGLTTGLHLAIVSLIIIFTAPILFDAVPPSNRLNFLITIVAL